MNYSSSPAASQPLASAKGIAAPLPSTLVKPPPERTIVVPAREVTEVKS